jgi:nitroimidazol reductase NimA-like FMN-containing flavoprotein (pyridoxamine 5'-phosphate oxidase superfamily)
MKQSRPTFASGYGISPDPTGLVPWGDVAAELAAARNYWIATVTPDGRPHATPIWGVWHEDRFYFGVDAQSQKSRNLEASSKAVVHLESGDNVVILDCDVRAEQDPERSASMLAAYASKYGLPADFSFDPVLVAVPHRVLTWQEADFPTTATEYRS